MSGTTGCAWNVGHASRAVLVGCLAVGVLGAATASTDPGATSTPGPGDSARLLQSAAREPRSEPVAVNINASREVVGFWGSGSPPLGFLWRPKTRTMSALPTLPGDTWSSPFAINDHGTIVGDSRAAAAAATHAVLWRAKSRHILELPGLDGHRRGAALAINDHGWIAGNSANHAVMWIPKTHRVIVLPGLDDRRGGAVAINDRRQIVGWFKGRDNRRHAFLWRPKTGEVDRLRPPCRGCGSVVASDINNNSQIVGSYSDQRGHVHAFLWRPKTQTMIDLGGQVGTKLSYASAINNNGKIVGIAIRRTRGIRAVMWTPKKHRMVVLPLLGERLPGAYDVNDHGWIVGESAGHAVMWTPRAHSIIDLAAHPR